MILNQSYKPDSIVLYVSFDEIPETLRDISALDHTFQIKKVKDMGPGTKWYYSLKNDNDFVIFLDDDVFIHNNLVKELVEYHQKYPFENLGFMGTSNNTFIHNEYLENCDKRSVDLLGGYRGVLIPWDNYTSTQREILLSSFEKLCDESKILDDDYFLYKVWKHLEIKSVVVKSKSQWDFKFANWSTVDNLNNEKNEEKMKEDRRRIDIHFTRN